MHKQSICIHVSDKSLVRLAETVSMEKKHSFGCFNRVVFSGNTMRHPKLRTFREMEDLDEHRRYVPRVQKKKNLILDDMA